MAQLMKDKKIISSTVRMAKENKDKYDKTLFGYVLTYYFYMLLHAFKCFYMLLHVFTFYSIL